MKIEINSSRDILWLLEDHPEISAEACVRIIKAYAGNKAPIMAFGAVEGVETEESRAKAHTTLKKWLKEHGGKLDNDPKAVLPGVLVTLTVRKDKTFEK